MAQDGPRRLKRPPRRPQDGPRGPQDGPRELQEALEESPRRQKTLIFRRFLKVFQGFACLGFRPPKTAQEACKIAPRQPKRPSKGPEVGPTGPQDRPRGPQEGPKTALKRSKRAPRRPRETPKTASAGVRRAKNHLRWPKWPQEAPKRPQEAPKRLPKCHPGEPEETKNMISPWLLKDVEVFASHRAEEGEVELTTRPSSDHSLNCSGA